MDTTLHLFREKFEELRTGFEQMQNARIVLERSIENMNDTMNSVENEIYKLEELQEKALDEEAAALKKLTEAEQN